MKTLAVIPMREGSRRVKDKNTLTIAGRTVLDWALDAVRECPRIYKVVAVTDSERLARYAGDHGIKDVIIHEDPEMASGDLPATYAVTYAVRYLEERGERYDAISEIYACVPVVPPNVQTKAIARLARGDVDSVSSATLVTQHPGWMGEIDDDDVFKPVADWLIEPNLDKKKHLYYFTGAAQVVLRDVLMSVAKSDWRKYWGTRLGAVVFSEPTVDIDTLLDVERAEFYLSRRQKRG